MSKQLRKDTDGRLRGGAEVTMPVYRYQRDTGGSEALSNRKDGGRTPNRELLCNLSFG